MVKNYDVIIAGTGAGGIYTALNLPDELKILVITKRDLILCNSALAQGGIAAVYQPKDDSVGMHTQDTLIAGGFKNNPDSLKILVNEAAHEIETILKRRAPPHSRGRTFPQTYFPPQGFHRL